MTYPEHIVRANDAARLAQGGDINLPALVEKYRNSSSPDVRKLVRGTEALLRVAHDLHWMSRRYADGRRSYAVGMFNDHTRSLLGLGVVLNPTGDGTLWAADGDGLRGSRAPEDMGPEWSFYREQIAGMGEVLDGLRLRAERAEVALRAAGLEVPGG